MHNKVVLWIIAYVFIVLSSSVLGALNDSSLIANYRFDEFSGGSADTLGVYNLTLSGSGNTTTGIINRSRGMFFSGSANGLSNCAIPVFSSTYTNFTMNVWIKINGTGLPSNILTIGKANGGDQGMVIYYWNTTAVYSDVMNKIQDPLILGTNNQWTMLTVVLNGTDRKAYYYVNGVNIKISTTYSAYAGTFSNELSVGSVRLCDDGYNGQNGQDVLVDELSLWNRKLTPAEITVLYNGGSGIAYPFAEPPTPFNTSAYNVTFPYTNNAITNNPVLTHGFTTVDPNYNYTIYTLTNLTYGTISNTTTTNKNITYTLSDGRYYYGLTIYNNASSNYFYDPNITIDTTPPSIVFNPLTTPNNSFIAGSRNVFVNLTVTDANYNYTIIRLYNSTGGLYEGFSGVCFQEQANVSTTCGGLSTGVYSTGIDPGDIGVIYINYTIPIGASNNSLWQVSYGVSNFTNFTIPNACWYGGTLQLKETSRGQDGTSPGFYCYNNTGWHTILPQFYITGGAILRFNSSYLLAIDGNYSSTVCYFDSVTAWSGGGTPSCDNARLTEEAMYWVQNNNLIRNFTNLSNGVYYFNATAYDLAGNSNSTDTRIVTVIGDFQNSSYNVTFPYPNNAYTNNNTLTYGFTTVDPNYNYTTYTLYDYTRWCYQESTNTTDQTGIDGNCNLNYTGKYSLYNDPGHNYSFLYINYTKPLEATSNSLWQVMYGPFGTAVNITIPISCWNYNSTKLSFRIASTGDGPDGNVTSFPQCYNGTWNTIGTIYTANWDGGSGASGSEYKMYDGDWTFVNLAFNSGGAHWSWSSSGWSGSITGNSLYATIFEEAMYWNTPLILNQLMNISTTNTSISFLLDDGKYYYALTIYDKGGNSQYYDPNITIDTTPPAISFTSNSTQNNTILSVPNIFIQTLVNDTNIDYSTIILYTEGGSVCYQEYANVSTSCGGVGTGVYGNVGIADSNWFDSDWNTYTDLPFPHPPEVYVNYSKPLGALNTSLWQVKIVGATLGSNYTANYTIPQLCFNQSIIQLRLFSLGAATPGVRGQCWNGASWTLVFNPPGIPSGDTSKLYEEGMFWNMSFTVINTTTTYTNGVVSVNYTGLQDGIYYFNAAAYDNASNYNTTPTWYATVDAVKDNITIMAHEVITNNTLPYNITLYINGTFAQSINYTGQTTTFSIIYANYSNVQVLSNGYVGCDYGVWNASENYVFPTCELSNHQINITMYNSYTSGFINNITSTLSINTYNYTTTQTVTNGYITHNIIQGLEYNITLSPPEYLNRTINYTATGNTASRNLSANQSIITVRFYHGLSGELINNANITMNDTSYTKIFNTSNGIILFTPNTGTHNLIVRSIKYVPTSHILSVNNKDQYILNITLYPILNFSIYDEKLSAINLTYFNFSKPSTIGLGGGQIRYTLYCIVNGTTSTTIQQIIPNNTPIGPYIINSTCVVNKVRFDLQYNNGDGSVSQYHRTIVVPATIDIFDFKVFIPELSTTTIVQTFLKPYDIFGIYTIAANTQVRVTKLMPSGVELMIADYMDAEGKITAYLIQGDSYIITILADGVPAKTLGPYNADTEGTKILRLFDVVLVSNTTIKEGTTTATSQFYELSENQSLLTLSYRDYANYTSSLTMSIYNGSCDDMGALLISSTLDYADLNTSGYDADLSYNVFGSRYMNHSSNIEYCAIHNVTYWDGTRANRKVPHVYDSWIPRPGEFEDPWTFPWIVMLLLVIIALGLNARTVSFGSIFITALAAILYAWNWISTGTPGVLSSVIIGVALLIAIMFALKRNVT